ncbi:MAG: M1 family aminopeptidase [Thermoanaerobaculia bacterium]
MLRWAGDTLPEALTGLPASDGPYAPSKTVADRHERWLRQRFYDADARILAALGTPGDSVLTADLETEDRGWMTVSWDASRAEEIEVEREHPRGLTESWLSLDRAEDRRPDGRPGPARRPLLDLTRVDLELDLTSPSKEPLQGLADVQPVDGEVTARLELRPSVQGLTALQLQLAPRAEVTAVRFADGAPLPFLRDHVGARSQALRKETWDSDLVVLLPAALAADEPTILEVDYTMRFDGYAPGRSWYPGTSAGALVLRDLHVGRMELTVRDDYDVRAMGERTDERRGDGTITSVWRVERPAKMLTFSLARKAHEETFERPELPPVAAFSSLGGFMNADRVHDVGSDVVAALAYFDRLLQSPLDVASLEVALIPAGHGQAFDGFLHLSDFSTATDSVAAGELFRAHEAAHQWWGHKVGWAGYRDQWLSEALAEYSAMMFVQSSVENGDRYFGEMLDAFTHELNGSLRSAFSQFARPGRSILNRRALDRVGPIDQGARCAVAEAPNAYQSQTYVKGALVLHMLRELTRVMTGSDEAFVQILRTFVHRYEGEFASTADFEGVVAEVVPADWSWFFDEWIGRAEIPTYRWSWTVSRADGGGAPFRLDVEIERRDVSDDFRMALPVRVTLEGGRTASVLAMVAKDSESFSFPLPERPREVELAPDRSVLAAIEKR